MEQNQEPKKNPCMDSQMIFDQNGKTNGRRKGISTDDVWETGYTHAKEWSWTLATVYTKINCKWITDLRVRPLRRKHRGELHNVRFSDNFFFMAPKHMAKEKRIGVLNYIKIKHLHASKDTVNRA